MTEPCGRRRAFQTHVSVVHFSVVVGLVGGWIRKMDGRNDRKMGDRNMEGKPR